MLLERIMASSTHQQVNGKWLKASMIGSLWASVEIILGSFLHNLKIPLSGTILTFISVFILVSFFQVWKEKGIIWRAGLICALMKSISPSAVILGPMIGIFTEAILLELMIALFGRNLFAYLVGGALAVFSALFHKIFMLIVLYGFNLVKLAEEIYYYFVRQINLPGLDPWYLIGLIVGIHLVLGITASFWGYFSGKKLHGKIALANHSGELTLHPESASLLTPGADRNYSLAHLLLIIAGTILTLALLNLSNLYVALSVSALFLVYSLVRYTQVFRKFKKPSMWIQFIIIVIGSSILLEGVSGGFGFAGKGLLIGLKMILRAIIIITGFSCLSIELRNPIIGNYLKKKGFTNLYRSLSLAFALLPSLLAEVEGNKKILSGRKWIFESMMIKTISFYEGLESSTQPAIRSDR